LRLAPTIAIVYGHGKLSRCCDFGQAAGAFSEVAMVQTTNRFFDDVARLMNDAAGAAQGMRREVETVLRSQAERVMRELDLVRREDFEAVKEMARIAREDNEALKARVAALEAALGIAPAQTPPAGAPGSASTAA
jgi:BMFP domain-containing protein YqiC